MLYLALKKSWQRSPGSKVYFVFFISFNKLFDVDNKKVYLILLLLLLLLLYNVIAFAFSELKLQTFVRPTAVVQKISTPLRSSTIMKGKITNSLKGFMIKPQTSDIRMAYEYIRVTYE